jgi:diguanylate cyclase (GGDEF)-like protein/PAS domain S-box-containing protein
MDRIRSEEQLRMQSLLQYHILDTPAESGFDDLTALASQICHTPIALITLLDEKRQWFKSRLGLGLSETPIDIAFCAYTVAQKKIFIVEDATKNPLFMDNPLVTGDPHICFYAGAPLTTPEGQTIGTLSVIDRIPRQLSDQQIEALHALSRHVVMLLEMRKNLKTLARTVEARDKAEHSLLLSKQTLEQKVKDRSQKLLIEVQEKIRERDVSDALINSLPGIFYVFDQTGKFLRWNDNFMRVTGYSREEMLRAHPLDFFGSAEDKQLINDKITEVFTVGNVTIEANLFTKDRRSIPYLFGGTQVQIGQTICLSGMGVDISARKQFETTLHEAEERYRQLVELSPDAVFVLKGEHCVFANKAAHELMGASTTECLYRLPFLHFVHPDYHEIVSNRMLLLDAGEPQVPRIEEKYTRLDGTVIDVEVSAALLIDKGSPARLVIARDITQAKQYQHQLEHQANYDSLTHLANRNLLHDRIEQAIAGANRFRKDVAIAFIDLDNFKIINDTLGHKAGDELLVAIGNRLKSCVRESDTVARHGGDEFVLVLNNPSNEAALGLWMAKLINQISRPISIAGHQLVATCSIGLGIYPRDGTDAQTLLKHADAAMYQAKAAGRNQVKFFAPSMNDRVKERFTMEAKLRRALERDEFILHYQPQVDLQTGEIIGAEALLRWNSPGDGLISPHQFIQIAEETNQIIAIGEWALEQACKDNKRLQRAGMPTMAVSVNLSPRQFCPYALVKSVQSALRKSQLRPEFLKLEVTETALMNQPEEAKEILCELKTMGVGLAIDDFGIGYSSLSYLQQFPVDQLKIDQSFIRDVADDPNDAAIAQAIITLGHSLNLNVIAEGVHNAQQLAFLRERSCDAMQGYYFSEALPFEQFEALLFSRQTAQVPDLRR